MRITSNRRSWFLLLVPVLLSLGTPQQVHADGGAPNLIYVSGTTRGISIIDVRDVIDTGVQKVTSTISVPGDPHTILLSLTGRELYVTQPTLGRFTTIAAKTGQSMCSIRLPGQPTLLALDSITGTMYAAGNGADLVTALNPMTCRVQHTFNTASSVFGIAVTVFASGTAGGNSNQLWVAGTNGLTIFDDQTGQLLDSVPLAGRPQYLLTPPGAVAYVSTHQGSVFAVDLQTRQVSELLSGGTFGPMDYDALNGEVYVPDAQHKVIDILTPITSITKPLPKEPRRTYLTDLPPISVAVTNDGLLGVIALSGGKVRMLDLLARRIIATIDVGGSPHFVITGPYPPIFDVTSPVSPKQAPRHTTVNNIPGAMLVGLSLVFAFLLILLLVGVLRVRKRQRIASQKHRQPAGRT
jgi:DNA-binding beta-propeller fold protein YncE